MGILRALVASFEKNRPKSKPQLWENLGLAARRRVVIELAERAREGWRDRGHVVELSDAGGNVRGPRLRMELFPNDVMDRALFLYGVYEIAETRLVQAFLRPGMTFLDVGANSGYYSLLAATLVGPSGAVHGFEPNDPVRARFERNVALNGLGGCIRVHREAISRETGETRFYRSVTEDNNGVSSMLPGPGLASEPVVVPCVTLDDFARTMDRSADLLKVDVERAEEAVFSGGKRVLGAADGPLLLFESFDVAPQLDLLKTLGYVARRVHYTLSEGLELRDPLKPLGHVSATYEAPNYVAAKSLEAFAELRARANDDRSAALRLLGRI
jgi:FkbM family methyltransferase